MKPLVIIPARGGSKGIPGKNIKLLVNKPLIEYTINAAKGVFDNSDICVSTDSKEIKEIVEKNGLGVPFLRPKELATDTASTYDVLIHAIDYYKEKGKEYDTVILLQPTSPFRNQDHIISALKIYENEDNIDMLVSVKLTHSNPYYVLFEENDKGFLEKSKAGIYSRRQDCPDVWEYNGAIYIINLNSLNKGDFSTFKKIKKFVMDEASSLDIDTKMDWYIAEYLMNNLSKKKII